LDGPNWGAGKQVVHGSSLRRVYYQTKLAVCLPLEYKPARTNLFSRWAGGQVVSAASHISASMYWSERIHPPPIW